MYVTQFEKNQKIIPLIKRGFIKYLLCTLLVVSFSFACSEAPSNYLFPGSNDSEVIRICRIVLNWKKRSFSVIEGNVVILKRNSTPRIIMNDSLPDGMYRCGRSDLSLIQCASGKKWNRNTGECKF